MKNKLLFRLILAGIWLGVTTGCVGAMSQPIDSLAEVQAATIIASYQELHGTPIPSGPLAIPTLVPSPTITPSPPVIIQADIVFVSYYEGTGDIYKINTNGSAPSRLTNNEANDFNPVWSPDGRQITFLSDRDGNSEIYVMNSDGSNQIRLTNNDRVDDAPAWSPDGKNIAFSSDRDGNREIYVMNSDGSNQTRLTDDERADIDPAWSPDGKNIGYLTYPDGIRSIYAMSADGLNQTRLTKTEVEERSPVWSPDGKKIMFASNGVIYLIKADGSEQTTILAEKFAYSPAWSPDGKRVAFGCNGGILCTMMTDGSGLITYDNVYLDNGLSWSPDGKDIAFKAINGPITMINVLTEDQVPLTDISNSYNNPVWSPVCAVCP